jgi:hypothetical protein
MTRKRILLIGLFLFIGFITLQFIQPHIENPKVTGDIEAPPEVKSILKRACYDCHSNETKLLWFDRISPASWAIAQHIKDGRNVLNSSEWGNLTTAQQKDKFWEAVNHTMLGAMPLKEYTLMHQDAKISESDLDKLKEYISGLSSPETYDTAITQQLFEQYNKWQTNAPNNTLPVAANGVAYDPDYKNWLPVSTTDAYANGTIRVIFGNAVAIQAIKENNTRVWPKGTTFAKVQWERAIDKEGNVYPGAFSQVEYMIKDEQKYADTEGWGWARFKTLELIPDGADASFTRACINCHRPVEDDDFVFTFPIKH